MPPLFVRVGGLVSLHQPFMLFNQFERVHDILHATYHLLSANVRKTRLRPIEILLA